MKYVYGMSYYTYYGDEVNFYDYPWWGDMNINNEHINWESEDSLDLLDFPSTLEEEEYLAIPGELI